MGFSVNAVKNLPGNAGQVQSLGQEEAPRKEMVTHSSILVYSPQGQRACRATVQAAKVSHDLGINNNNNNTYQ